MAQSVKCHQVEICTYNAHAGVGRWEPKNRIPGTHCPANLVEGAQGSVRDPDLGLDLSDVHFYRSQSSGYGEGD